MIKPSGLAAFGQTEEFDARNAAQRFNEMGLLPRVVNYGFFRPVPIGMIGDEVKQGVEARGDKRDTAEPPRRKEIA